MKEIFQILVIFYLTVPQSHHTPRSPSFLATPPLKIKVLSSPPLLKIGNDIQSPHWQKGEVHTHSLHPPPLGEGEREGVGGLSHFSELVYRRDKSAKLHALCNLAP